jgi:hypothetical protein
MVFFIPSIIAILRTKDDVNHDFTERLRHEANDGPKRRRNESRFQRWTFGVARIPGALPQARLNAAPLALNTYTSPLAAQAKSLCSPPLATS